VGASNGIFGDLGGKPGGNDECRDDDGKGSNSPVVDAPCNDGPKFSMQFADDGYP